MCPECNEVMIVLDIEGIEIDYCVECKGTWLDDGELELIGGLADIQPGALTDALLHAKRIQKVDKRCPRCKTKLEMIEVAVKDGCPAVELDRCPRGHGLWFNQGEVEAVIRGSCDEESQAVSHLLKNIYPEQSLDIDQS